MSSSEPTTTTTTVPERPTVIDDDGETLFREPEVGVHETSSAHEPVDEQHAVFDVRDLSVFYSDFRAVRNISLVVRRHEITAFHRAVRLRRERPSSAALNRMNDLVPSARIEGQILHHGSAYDPEVNLVLEVRRRIGMVFQKPNPFRSRSTTTSPPDRCRRRAAKGSIDNIVEKSLRRRRCGRGQGPARQEAMAALRWSQQQLCIARPWP